MSSVSSLSSTIIPSLSLSNTPERSALPGAPSGAESTRPPTLPLLDLSAIARNLQLGNFRAEANSSLPTQSSLPTTQNANPPIETETERATKVAQDLLNQQTNQS